MHLLGRRATPTLQVVASANQNDYNLFVAAGSPAAKLNIVLTINAGIEVRATSGTYAAMRTAGFAAGSTLKIINNGSIQGAGGAGGAGAWWVSPVSFAEDGSPGVAGKDAIDLALPLTIDNTNGYVRGGGGGGGGSSGTWATGVPDVMENGGGGGGGGRGNNNAAGGVGGTGSTANGQNGTAGSGSSSGAGGLGGGGTFSGGAGSDWGSMGIDGATPGSRGVGGVGGAAGKAIDLNGNSITWLGGNNAMQVRGVVS